MKIHLVTAMTKYSSTIKVSSSLRASEARAAPLVRRASRVPRPELTVIVLSPSNLAVVRYTFRFVCLYLYQQFEPFTMSVCTCINSLSFALSVCTCINSLYYICVPVSTVFHSLYSISVCTYFNRYFAMILEIFRHVCTCVSTKLLPCLCLCFQQFWDISPCHFLPVFSTGCLSFPLSACTCFNSFDTVFYVCLYLCSTVLRHSAYLFAHVLQQFSDLLRCLCMFQ